MTSVNFPEDSGWTSSSVLYFTNDSATNSHLSSCQDCKESISFHVRTACSVVQVINSWYFFFFYFHVSFKVVVTNLDMQCCALFGCFIKTLLGLKHQAFTYFFLHLYHRSFWLVSSLHQLILISPYERPRLYLEILVNWFKMVFWRDLLQISNFFPPLRRPSKTPTNLI